MIFWSTLSTEPPNTTAFCEAWKEPEDILSVGKWKNQTKRHEALLTRALLRALLHHVTGEKDWAINHAPSGKPHASTSQGNVGPHISLSHTKHMVACAVSFDKPVGIDIERHRARSLADIAAYAFGPNEQEQTKQGGPEAFYQIWTQREAIAKTTGDGLFTDDIGKDMTESSAWNLFYTRLSPNYSLAIATPHLADEPIPEHTQIDFFATLHT